MSLLNDERMVFFIKLLQMIPLLLLTEDVSPFRGNGENYNPHSTKQIK